MVLVGMSWRNVKGDVVIAIATAIWTVIGVIIAVTVTAIVEEAVDLFLDAWVLHFETKEASLRRTVGHRKKCHAYSFLDFARRHRQSMISKNMWRIGKP